MKKHFFFVYAKVKFKKTYVNSKYDSDENDQTSFSIGEIFGIEQKETETELFYLNLKNEIKESVEKWMHCWVEKTNSISNNAAWKWEKVSSEILNISLVGLT